MATTTLSAIPVALIAALVYLVWRDVGTIGFLSMAAALLLVVGTLGGFFYMSQNIPKRVIEDPELRDLFACAENDPQLKKQLTSIFAAGAVNMLVYLFLVYFAWTAVTSGVLAELWQELQISFPFLQ